MQKVAIAIQVRENSLLIIALNMSQDEYLQYANFLQATEIRSSLKAPFPAWSLKNLEISFFVGGSRGEI